MPTIIYKRCLLPEVYERRSVEDVEPLGSVGVVDLDEVDP